MRGKTRDVERVSYRKCEYQVVHSLINEGHTRSNTNKCSLRARTRFAQTQGTKPKGTKPKGTVRVSTAFTVSVSAIYTCMVSTVSRQASACEASLAWGDRRRLALMSTLGACDVA